MKYIIKIPSLSQTPEEFEFLSLSHKPALLTSSVVSLCFTLYFCHAASCGTEISEMNHRQSWNRVSADWQWLLSRMMVMMKHANRKKMKNIWELFSLSYLLCLLNLSYENYMTLYADDTLLFTHNVPQCLPRLPKFFCNIQSDHRI